MRHWPACKRTLTSGSKGQRAPVQMGGRLVVPETTGADHGMPNQRTVLSRTLEQGQADGSEGPAQVEGDLGHSCSLAARRSSTGTRTIQPCHRQQVSAV